MPSPSNHLPVFGIDNELLYYVPAGRAQSLIDAGKVSPRGSKHRVRAVVATCGKADSDLRLLRLDRLPPGTHDTYKYENDENPRGVWSFKFRKVRQYAEMIDAA